MRSDVQRLLNRARASSGGRIDLAELRYLRSWCCLLLFGPLAPSDGERARVEELYADVLAALAECAVERIESGA